MMLLFKDFSVSRHHKSVKQSFGFAEDATIQGYFIRQAREEAATIGVMMIRSVSKNQEHKNFS